MKGAIAAVALVVMTGCGGGLLPAARQAPTPPPPELKSVRIGIVALEDFIQLPLALGLQRGYFAERGITVETVDEANGAAALADLGKGNVDLISVPYEFTIRAQINGTSVKAIALYLLRPGFVVSIGKPHFNDVHGMKDFVGHPVCVTARGTATENMLTWLAVQEGVDPSSIPLRACGTAIAEYSTLLGNGDVWGAVQVDPPFSKLEKEGWARALYDTRSEQAAKRVYGGSGLFPSNALIAPAQFLTAYPNTSSELVAAIVEALRYIQTHSAVDIARNMPAEYKQGDPSLYISSLQSDRGMYSPDGNTPAAGPPEVLKVLQVVLPSMSDVQIDLSQTFDNSFARRAAGG